MAGSAAGFVGACRIKGGGSGHGGSTISRGRSGSIIGGSGGTIGRRSCVISGSGGGTMRDFGLVEHIDDHVVELRVVKR